MKSLVKLFLGLTILATTFASCKKNGIGGSATIVAFPQHHGKMIMGATVYVKFNSNELPINPTTNYDLKVIGEATEEHVHIMGMLPGNYFLYAVAIDSALKYPNNIVKGGIAVKIANSQKKKEIDIDIPVTE